MTPGALHRLCAPSQPAHRRQQQPETGKLATETPKLV